MPSDTTADRFRRVAGRFTQVTSEVSGNVWNAPAPCAGWTARDIVAHLTSWVPSVLAPSGITFPSGPGPDTDPAGAWRALADTLQAALDDPEVAARRFDAGPPGELTVEQAIGMLVTGDVLVHTWDLARSAGLDDHLDPAVTADMLAGMEPIDELLRGSGHYGPRVAVPADADVQTRLIAFTGRDPYWTAPPA